MTLTETQITQANALIKKYKFCSLETQKRLQDAGFFEMVECNFGLEELILPNGKNIGFTTSDYMKFLGKKDFLPFPQFHEVWEALPEKVYSANKRMTDLIIYYKDVGIITETPILNRNITESACLLWLKLKENNLL